MLRLLRSTPFRCLAGLRGFSTSAFQSSGLSPNSSGIQSPTLGSTFTTKGENLKLHHLTRGIVVRSLPKNLDEASLVSELKTTFRPVSVDLKLDIQEKPAFAILRFNDEESVNSALSLHKTLISGKRVYVCTINDFIAASPTIGSGHDSRKLILYNLSPTWSSEEIYQNFSLVGSIMKCSIPRDYSLGSLIMNDQKYFNEIIGPQKIDLTRVSGLKVDSSNVFQDVRSFLMSEFDRIRFLMYFKGNNSAQVFQGLSFVWEKLNKFKDVFGVDISSKEKEINEMFNSLSGSASEASIKEKLVTLYSEVFQEFNATLDEYFKTKGFARVEFATREQAERALTLAYCLRFKGMTIQAAFDRNLPDYFFNSQFLSEAHLREMSTKNNAFPKKEAEVKINHHLALFHRELLKVFKLNPLINNSLYSDPLISQHVRTKSEAKDMIANIEGGHLSISKKRPEDFFSNKNPQNMTPASEKLEDDRQKFTQQLNKQFILFPDKVPVRKEEIKAYQIVPDREFPSEMPPKRLWSTSREKTQAYEAILSYSQFFHEEIPDQVKQNPSVLQKEKFGDFPFTRHVFEPSQDFKNLNKETRSLWKRREIIENIRKKIRDLPNNEDIGTSGMRFVELGAEEYNVLKEKDDLSLNTDSEVEENVRASTNSFDIDETKAKIKESKKKLKEVVKFIEKFGIPPPNLEFNKTFKYDGQDIDKYVEELNTHQFINAKWIENESGEKIVCVNVKKEAEFDVDEAERLVEKYGDLVMNAENDEIDIDEEDVEMMQKIRNFKFDPKKLFNLMLHHYAYKDYEKKFQEYTSTEPIELYGHLAPKALKFIEKNNVENTLSVFTRYKGDN